MFYKTDFYGQMAKYVKQKHTENVSNRTMFLQQYVE